MVLLYIDPGTGSMLITIAAGLISSVFFAIKELFFKVKYGRTAFSVSENKIPLVIFADDKRYWNIFGPICDELETRGITVEYWTMSEDDPAFSRDYKTVSCIYIGNGNKAFIKLNNMNAKICLATTPGLDVLQWKRSKYVDKYIHIPHNVGAGPGYRMFGLDFYDEILLYGEFQKKYIRQLEEMRHLPPKKLTVLGSVYLDELLKRHINDRKKYINEEKVVLLAPSWGQDSILNKYGEKIIGALVLTGYKIIIRPHPETCKREKKLLDYLTKKYSEFNNIVWNYDIDNFNCLSQADIMISDFSGIIFDFSLVFNKPVIYADTEFSKDVYDWAWFDEEMWQLAVAYKIGKKLDVSDFDHIKDIIDSVRENEEYKNGRNEIRDIAWMNREKSLADTVDYLEKML